jgi:hypothetical protein
MSQHQMSLYLKLILGLPIPDPADSVSAFPCGQTHDFMVTTGFIVSITPAGPIVLLTISFSRLSRGTFNDWVFMAFNNC